MMRNKIEEIRRDVEEKTGIDFRKYRRPDLVNAFVDAITTVASPLKVIGTIIKYILVEALLVNGVLTLVWYQKRPELWVTILFFVVGNLGFTVVAIAVGVVRSIRQGVLRASEAMAGALEIADQALEDIEDLEQQHRKVAPVDIVRGALFVAIVPSVREAIAKKLGFISKPMTFALDSLSVNLSERLPKLIAAGMERAADSDSSDSTFDKQRYAAIIANLKSRVEPFVRKTILGKVTLPFTLAWALTSAITLTALTAIYLFLM